MRGDAALDYAEFQLSGSGKRFKLFVSGEGVTEKLASGFLKPFLAHLHAAEGPVGRGCRSIRLECKPGSSADRNGKDWFTKGTIERFVRFVSTPEVLEQVKSIEDELIQLRIVQRIHTDDRRFAHTDGPATRHGSMSSKTEGQGRNETQTVSETQSVGTGDEEKDASKRELVRATNVRLLALQQEQNIAFSCADAAGFDSDNVADLMAFAEKFGANQLHKACMDFLTLFKKKAYETKLKLEKENSSTGEVSSNGSDMSLESDTDNALQRGVKVISHNAAGNTFKTAYSLCKESQKPNASELSIAVPVRKEQQKTTCISTRTSSIEGWNPENIYTDHLQPLTGKWKNTTPDRERVTSNQFESDSNNQQSSVMNVNITHLIPGQDHLSSKIELETETKARDESVLSQLQEMAEKVEARNAECQREHIRSNSAGPFYCVEAGSENSGILERTGGRYETGYISSDISTVNLKLPLGDKPGLRECDIEGLVHLDTNPTCLCQMSLSPEMPASLYLETKTEPPASEHQEILRSSSLLPQKYSVYDKGRNKESDCRVINTKDHVNSDFPTHSELQAGYIEPTRRLSVQDAISLFEGKKKNSNDLPAKRLTKQGGKVVIESTSSSLPEKSVLRQWGGVNKLTSELISQQNRDAASGNEDILSQSHQEACKSLYEENSSVVTDGQRGGIGEEATMSENGHLPIISESLNELFNNASSSFKKATSQLQWKLKPESQPFSVVSDRQLQLEQQQAMNESLREVDVDLQKQFSLEVAGGFTKEASEVKSKNLETIISFNAENDKLEAKNSTLNGKVTKITEAGKTNLSQSVSDVESRSEQGKMNLPGDASKRSRKFIQESSAVLNQQSDTGSHPMSWSSSSLTQIVNDKHFHRSGQAMSDIEPKAHSVRKVHFSSHKGRSTDNNTRVGVGGHGKFALKIEHKGGNESSGNSRDKTSLEFDMQAVVANIVHNKSNDQTIFQCDALHKTKRGKFYEHYSKLRDAKLRDEKLSKKAEHEKKLRAIEESLERRKAEMKSRTVRSPRSNNLLGQGKSSVKSETQKASLLAKPRKQEEEEDIHREECSMEMQDRNQTNVYYISNSPSSTPHVGNRLLLSKRCAVKKDISQKSASTVHGSSHVLNSISPKSVSKNLEGKSSGRRKSVVLINQASIIENPLSRSAPLSNLRMESTKTSIVRTPGHRVHSKGSGHAGRQHMTIETLCLGIVDNNAARPLIKEDKKQNSVNTKKSCATRGESKHLPDQGHEGKVLASFKVQNEGIAESALYNKVKCSVTVPTQEASPSLHKGQGIVPVSRPGILKLKVSSPVEKAKTCVEEAFLSPTLNAVDELRKDTTEGPESTVSGVTSEIDITIDSAETPCGQLLLQREDQLEKTEVLKLSGVSELSGSDTKSHTTPISGEFMQCKQECVYSSASQLVLAQRSAESGQNDSPFTASSSFRTNSLNCEHMIAPFSLSAASLCSSSMPPSGRIAGHFSPPSVTLETSLGSPASWNSSQIQYVSESDMVHGGKMWGNPDRPTMIVTQHPPKEPSKGLKRLLKFGRKNRASETIDWVSASTTSEGDDDPDETRDLGSASADSLLRREKMQELDFDVKNATGERVSYNNSQDQGASQSLWSSIPVPPAHFKLREDHLSGSTFLKAPRSFFSLSSFRCKTGEEKA